MDTCDQYFDCLCRTCLNEVETSSCGANITPHQQWQSIYDRIEECGKINELLSQAVPQIEMELSDELPTKICCKCLQQLLSAYRFQQMCVQSEGRIRKLVSKRVTDLKMSMIEQAMKREFGTNDTDTCDLETIDYKNTSQSLGHPSIQEPLHEIREQITDPKAAQSSIVEHLENIDKLLETCKVVEGSLNEFIKTETIGGDGDMHSMIPEAKEEVLFIKYTEVQINGIKDHIIETVAEQSHTAEHLQSNDQTLEHCKDSQGELIECIKNEPIENDESNIDYSDGHQASRLYTIQIAEDPGLKGEGLPIESEERQVYVIYAQHHHEKKDNRNACGKKRNIRSNSIHSAILKKHACALCDKSFKTAIALKRHARAHTGNRPQCEKSSSTSRNDGDKRYECPYCPQKFRSKQSMKRHQQIHKGVKREACEICGKNIRKMNLNKHKLLHTGEKPHKCDVCEKRFIRIQQLRGHMRTHTGEKPFKCKYCKLAYTTSGALTQHLRHHLGDNVFRCEFCPLAFPLASKLRSHFITHKNEDPETRERNMKAMKEQESKLRLQICKKKTQKPITKKKTEQPSKEKLQQQLQIKSTDHGGDKPYECSHCPQRFRSKQSMRRHQQIHEGVKRETCEICGKSIRKMNLNKHKLLHTGEKPHKCDVCEKRFIRIQQLRGHMLTHTGEKPFKCKYCKLAYTTSGALRQHLRRHLGDNVFRCDFCPLAFPLASELRSHFTTHKNEDPETRERNMKALSEQQAKLKQKFMKNKTQRKSTEEQQEKVKLISAQ